MQKSRLKNWRQRQTNLFQSFICSNTAQQRYTCVFKCLWSFNARFYIASRTHKEPTTLRTFQLFKRCTHKWDNDESCWMHMEEMNAEISLSNRESSVQEMRGNGTIFVRSPPYSCLYRQTTVCCRSIYWCVTARSSRPFAVDVVRDGPDARAISCSCPAHHIISKLTKEEMESVYISYSIDHRRGLLSICWAFVLCYTEPVSLLCCVSRADLYM